MMLEFWRGKRVLITGHTGFKGSWLSLMLAEAGANVCGYALAPNASGPNLFDALDLAGVVDHHVADIRDLATLAGTVRDSRPEIVFHLAAQALVSPSYDDPVSTYGVNVMGTVHLLESCRHIDSVRSIVIVTSDKCYENHGWVWGYREIDALGGSDPYSNSKACAELVAKAYRSSFFSPACVKPSQLRLATARAGNVIGGGDWSQYRLVPDAIRAFLASEPLRLRNPRATRPWQHVLEPLVGYCSLAAAMWDEPIFADAWNFGPNQPDNVAVSVVADRLCAMWGEQARWELATEATPGEARLLHVDSAKARAQLGWQPALTLEQALSWTTDWYKAYAANMDLREVTRSQIADYLSLSEPKELVASR